MGLKRASEGTERVSTVASFVLRAAYHSGCPSSHYYRPYAVTGLWRDIVVLGRSQSEFARGRVAVGG
jgi:hypothetical protein